MAKVSTSQDLENLLKAHSLENKDSTQYREKIASKIVCDLGALSQQAYNEGKFSVSLKANELLGKEFGLFNHKQSISIEDWTPRDWTEALMRLSSSQLRHMIEGFLRAD